MNSRRAGIVMLAVALLSGERGAAAQEAPPRAMTRGISIDGYQSSATVHFHREGTDTGYGVGGRLAYGVSSYLSFYVGGDYTAVRSPRTVPDGGHSSTYGLTNYEVGMRVHLAQPGSVWVPHLDIASTLYAVSWYDAQISGGTGDLEFTGEATSLGLGIQYFYSPQVAFSFDGKVTGGEFTTRYYGGSEELGALPPAVNSLRIHLGMAWYPRWRR